MTSLSFPSGKIKKGKTKKKKISISNLKHFEFKLNLLFLFNDFEGLRQKIYMNLLFSKVEYYNFWLTSVV